MMSEVIFVFFSFSLSYVKALLQSSTSRRTQKRKKKKVSPRILCFDETDMKHDAGRV